MNESFWPSPVADSFDPPGTLDDHDHDLDRMRDLEDEYLANQEIPKTKSIGEVLASVFASITKYCGPAENAMVQNLRELPYQDYLKTEHWQKTRDEALRLGRHECRICRAKKTLDVHHRTYERLGHEDQADLVVLCRICHRLFHEHGRLASKD